MDATLFQFPPPLWGRVGRGVIVRHSCKTTPTPNPSPQGGGEHVVGGEGLNDQRQFAFAT
jgi:hypothetical protein